MIRIAIITIICSLATFTWATSVVGPKRTSVYDERIKQRVYENLNPKHVAATYVTVSRQFALMKAANIPDPHSLISRHRKAVQEMRTYLLEHLIDGEDAVASIDSDTAAMVSDLNTVVERFDEVVKWAHKLTTRAAPSPMLEHLYTFDPDYGGNGPLQVKDDLIVTDKTDGSGAGDGLVFKIERPQSWMQTHTRGRASVYRARSEASAGLCYIEVRVLDFPDNDQSPDLSDLVAQTVDNDAYPDREFISSSPTEIFGLPGQYCDFQASSTGHHGASHSFNRHYLVIYNQHIIKIEISVKDLARSADELLPTNVIKAQFRRHYLFFDEIVKRMRVTETE